MLRAPTWSTSAYRAHDVQVARVHDLGDDRQAGVVARRGQHLEALLAEALEGVGRGARLEGAAAQHVAARRLDGAGGLQHLLRRLDGARAGDEGEVPAADLDAVHVDHRVALLELAAHQLVGPQDRDHPVHARHGLERQLRDLLAVADDADDRDALAQRRDARWRRPPRRAHRRARPLLRSPPRA